MEEEPATRSLTPEFSHELALAMIEYIGCSHHILFVADVANWKEFHTSSSKNFEKFADLSPIELCEEFVIKVLPHIYEFELSPSQLESFELLKLHNEYQRVEHGYQRLPRSERLTACREPRLNVDYCIQSPTFQPPVSPCRELEAFSLTPDLQNIHTVVSSNRRQVQKAGVCFQFSARCHSLISAVLSDDLELSGCVVLEPKELHQRLRAAKVNFEQNAVMLRNAMNVENLLSKLQNLYKLRRTLARIMDDSFI